LRADDQALGRLKEALSQLRNQVSVRNLTDAVAVLNRTQDLAERHVSILPGAVGLEFVHADLDTLDQFSSLIPPEKAGGPSVGLKDNVVGIGVEVEPHSDGLKVLKVLPGGPAADVQMRRGDVLTAVDRHPLKGLDLNQAVDHILGQPGAPLHLNLIRAGRRGEVTLVRRRIALHAVASRMLDDKRRVGYIKLDSFNDSCVRELDDALMSLHNEGMTSLVLDLRGNPGGLLTAAIEISDRFLPEGTIVSTKGRNPSDNTREEAAYGQTWKVPMVVLIDRNSASASEILAAAIQENGRGVIVGERSYGKGTVQTLFPLHAAPAGLRLTTAKFYSPEGREMSGAGVTPDLKVDPTIGDDADNDAAIAAALKLAADPRLKDMALHFIRTGEAPRVFRITI
jgi:carboxyl-terminal processing protease